MKLLRSTRKQGRNTKTTPKKPETNKTNTFNMMTTENKSHRAFSTSESMYFSSSSSSVSPFGRLSIAHAHCTLPGCARVIRKFKITFKQANKYVQ